MKNIMYLIIGTVIALSALNVQASTFNPADQRICFYDQRDFRGAEFCYSGIQEIRNLGNAVNKFQSFKIPTSSGLTLRVFNGRNFSGERSNLYASANLPVVHQLNIESIKITGPAIIPTANQACFYEKPFYKGKTVCFSVGGHQDVFTGSNQTYSSSVFGVNVGSATVWIFRGYGGTRVTSEHGLTNFRRAQSIRSVQVRPGSSNENGSVNGNVAFGTGNAICFYSGRDFRGQEFCYSTFRNKDFRNIKVPGNRFVSVRIPRGYQLRAHTRLFLQGSPRVVSGSMNLPASHARRIHSMRLVVNDAFNFGGNQVCFYALPNYGGKEYCYSGSRRGRTISSLGSADNVFGSVKIPNGSRLRVFNNRNSGGARSNFIRSVAELPRVHFKQISSIRVTNRR